MCIVVRFRALWLISFRKYATGVRAGFTSGRDLVSGDQGHLGLPAVALTNAEE